MVNHRFQLTRRLSHSKTVKKTDARGFTIIEIMIVLAIAGLIMLVVFLAVPALQKSARDTGRKEAASIVLTQLNEYKMNNSLSFPDNSQRCQFIKQYLTQYVSPTAACVDGGCTDGVFVQGTEYSFCFHTSNSSPHEYLSTNEDEISIQAAHWCNYAIGVTNNGGDPIYSNGNELDFRFGTVWLSLERARMFCIDNH
ncbi:MAG: type II secretion system protein [Candidatus Saccharimonadales bacterium]